MKVSNQRTKLHKPMVNLPVCLVQKTSTTMKPPRFAQRSLLDRALFTRALLKKSVHMALTQIQRRSQKHKNLTANPVLKVNSAKVERPQRLVQELAHRVSGAAPKMKTLPTSESTHVLLATTQTPVLAFLQWLLHAHYVKLATTAMVETSQKQLAPLATSVPLVPNGLLSSLVFPEQSD